MKKQLISLIIILLLLGSVKAQEKTFGVQFSPSYTVLFQQNDFNASFDSENERIIGLHLGGFYHFNFEKWSLRNTVELSNKLHRYDPLTQFSDINGQNFGAPAGREFNFSTNVGSIATLNNANGFFIGLGISANILIASFEKVDGISIQGQDTNPDWIRNYQYRQFVFSLPFLIGHDWEFSHVFLKLSFDVSNRLPKESFITQRENMIQLGYGIRLNRSRLQP